MLLAFFINSIWSKNGRIKSGQVKMNKLGPWLETKELEYYEPQPIIKCLDPAGRIK